MLISRDSRLLSVAERYFVRLPAPRERVCGTRYKHIHVRSAVALLGHRRSRKAAPAGRAQTWVGPAEKIKGLKGKTNGFGKR